MTARGDLLELLVDSDERWQTVRCRLDARLVPPELPRLRIGTPRSGEVAYDVVATARPFRVRLTRITGSGPDEVVDDGEQVWVREGDRVQVLTRPMGGQHTAEVRSALLPRTLVGRGALRLVGERDGALQVRGGDAGELLVDATTGVLLSQRWEGSRSVLLSDVRYDEPVGPDAFARLEGAVVQRGLKVPARYAPGLVVGLLLAAAGEAAVQLPARLRRLLPR